MNRILILIVAASLAACDSGIETPSEYPTTNIDGVAAMGLTLTGDVSAYDYSACTKGRLLGEDKLSNSNKFNFDINPPQKETPVLLELSNFSYIEEASGALVTITDKSLYASLIIDAGNDQSATISIWTHLAQARTAYSCGQDPKQVATYILKSNDDFAQALTFDPVTLFPQQIVEGKITILNVPAIRYGVANAAVSYFTSNLDYLDGGDAKLHVNFNSMSFAELAYSDLIYDKFLNGFGELGQLSLGAVMISADTYRSGLANLMNYASITKDLVPADRLDQIQMVASTYNDSTHMDVFPGLTSKPLGLVSSVNLTEVKYASCNYCWSNQGADGPRACAMAVKVNFSDYISAPISVEMSYKSASETPTVTQAVAIPNGVQFAQYGFNFAYNNPIPERTITVTAKNVFGITKNFEVGIAANAGLGTSAGQGPGWVTTSRWSPYGIYCYLKAP